MSQIVDPAHSNGADASGHAAVVAEHQQSAYDLFIAIVAVVSICVITWQLTLSQSDEMYNLLEIFDWGFCALFLMDYVRNIIKAQNKRQYLLGWGLLDLVSSIPAIGPLRYARVARIFRVIRVIRGVRLLVQVYRQDRMAFAVAGMMAGGVVIVLGATTAVLHVERAAEGGSIDTGAEAAWWAVVTVSTVGYGDLAPVTDAGRLLAVILMVVGIGLFATFAGAIANVFTRQDQSRADGQTIEERLSQIEQFQREVRDLLREQKSSGE
ncbi:MAG: ion transporter [Phycisphaerae bacterium]|jgi:voltage-gated potassium channel|nr:ion transporter [Phycisphaerae bacterium]MBT5382561.1 ion transporter [Phycisphaerae bacterium]